MLWWKERIARKYLDQVNARAVQEFETALSAKEKEISYLRQQNESLAKIIHKDNKLIPAMEYSVRELFCSAGNGMDRTLFHKRALELLKELEHIFQDRKGLLQNYETAGKRLPATNIVSVDILLAYMLQKASGQNIDFDVTLLEDMSLVTEQISGVDLRTLLADLLENALIAVSDCKTKKALLSMGSRNRLFTIDVYDSGPPFPEEALAGFGIRPVTTHKDEGGSSIGLMTVWKLCTKYGANFTVKELSSGLFYTKKVSVCFPCFSPDLLVE